MNFEKYTDRARGFIQSAQSLAQREGHQQFSNRALLKVLLDDPGVCRQADRPTGGRRARRLRRSRRSSPTVPRSKAAAPARSNGARAGARVRDAEKVAEKAGDSFVTVERMLLALAIEKSSEGARCCAAAGVTPQSLNAAIEQVRKGRTADSASAENAYDALKKYGRDLTQAARENKLDPVIGRDTEITRVIQILSRRTKNNPILIGEAGVGKTAVAEGLAQRIAAIPTSRDRCVEKEIIQLDLGLFDRRYEISRRIRRAAQGGHERSGTFSEGKIILFIDEIHTLVGAGAAEGSMDASNMLKPALGARRHPRHRRHDPQGISEAHRARRGAHAPFPAGVQVNEPSRER